MNTQLAAYIERLIQEYALGTPIEDRDKAEMKKDIEKRLLKMINLDLLAAIPEAKSKELATLINSDPSIEKIQAFIEANIPNKEEIVAKTLLDFRAVYTQNN